MFIELYVLERDREGEYSHYQQYFNVGNIAVMRQFYESPARRSYTRLTLCSGVAHNIEVTESVEEILNKIKEMQKNGS